MATHLAAIVPLCATRVGFVHFPIVTQASPIVMLAGVGVRVGATTILRDVDLRIEPGEIVGLYGANGAGKTTLLRVMGTLLRPSEGTGTVFGADISSSDRYDVRPRIGLIGHTPALYPELTLIENLDFAGNVAGLDGEAAEEALAAVGLAAAKDRRAEDSSHGMQRRAEFARELMMQLDLLLLDEPHSALDAVAVDLVEALVHRVADRGGAVVLVSHDRARVDAISARSLVIASGTVS